MNHSKATSFAIGMSLLGASLLTAPAFSQASTDHLFQLNAVPSPMLIAAEKGAESKCGKGACGSAHKSKSKKTEHKCGSKHKTTKSKTEPTKTEASKSK